MALTRKFLSALGIEAEKIDEIINAHSETVDALKADRDKYKADVEKLEGEKKDIQKELDDLKDATEADRKSREGKDYDALKKEYDEYKADVEAKATKAAKETALRDILKDLNISEKGVKLALKYHNIDEIELDGDGNVKNSADLRKALKEDWGDYTVKTEEQGAKTPNPPDGNGKSYKSKEEIMNIKNRAERQKAIAENPDLFGIEGD